MTAKLLMQGVEVGIVTTNADAMVAFYQDFLGLESQGELKFDGGHMKRFGVGQSVVKVVTFDRAPTAANPVGSPDLASGFRYLTLVVENLVDLHRAAQDAGGEGVTPISEFQAGIGYFFLQDPDGNMVELAGPI